MRIFLIEMQVYDRSLEYVKTLRFSTGKGFDTGQGDVFLPRIISPGLYERHYFSRGSLSGLPSVGFGDVILANADGGLDDFYSNYSVDGRRITIYRGEDTASFPDGFTTLFSGTVQRAAATWYEVRIILRSLRAEVAQRLISEVRYAGDNSLPDGLEGVEGDIKGTPKPILLGLAYNLTPVLVNTSKLIYQITDKPGDMVQSVSVDAVYDRGAVLTEDTQQSSLASLLSTTPTSGQYDWYDGDEGTYIRLGSNPSGQITVDATEGDASTDRTAAQITKRVLRQYGIPEGEINGVADLDSAQPATVGYYSGLSETAVGSVIDFILGGIGASWVDSRTGGFTLKRLALPSGESNDKVINSSNALRDKGNPVEVQDTEEAGLLIPAYRVTVEYERMWTVQEPTDLAGIVASDQARVNRLGREYRSVVEEDTTIQSRNPLAKEFLFISSLTDSTAAAAEAARQFAIRSRIGRIVVVQLALDESQGLDLGSIVCLQFNRFGLSSGEDGVIIGLREAYGDRKSPPYTELFIWS